MFIVRFYDSSDITILKTTKTIAAIIAVIVPIISAAERPARVFIKALKRVKAAWIFMYGTVW